MLQKNPNSLSAYDEVKTLVLSKILPLQQSEAVPLHALVGRVLAEELVSPLNLPSWPQSAMDGYAFSSLADSCLLPVVDCLYAGQEPKMVSPNNAVRIMTGALLPEGLDTVIPFEEAMLQTDKGMDQLLRPEHLKVGRHVKPVGSDVQFGQALLKKGHRITARDIGLMASIGLTEAKVVRKLKVAILTSGDELLLPGQPYSLGKTYDANSDQISALCSTLPVEVVACDRVSDDIETVAQALSHWSEQVDIVLTLGGASAGQKDFIKTVLSSYDESWFWKLAMKPAKPFAMARKSSNSAWVLALPGNPLAAFMSFHLFVLGVIKKHSGQASWAHSPSKVRLLSPLFSDKDRVRWIQVVKTPDGVVPIPNVSASQLAVLSGATGFVRLQPEIDYREGVWVDYWGYGCAE
ncbi:molybdopterin molybdotransferase MoeA [Hydrogenovibrio kuenenii]|uniref:molybdopterin molybdotransferase MoeA n=1 Tax=Hydrogenovibrio kuenenii TaxID=63658 RepID=UPI0004676A57|nr:molybdopterin molybdotransferase MoeA [Hydrogenovibrio kuenenii]